MIVRAFVVPFGAFFIEKIFLIYYNNSTLQHFVRRSVMAYYLRKENKKKGTYLQMYESHWDKEKKQSMGIF